MGSKDSGLSGCQAPLSLGDGLFLDWKGEVGSQQEAYVPGMQKDSDSLYGDR